MEDKKKEKILVVRYRFIGDTILTVPFLRNLRYAYPNAQIDLLIAPNSAEIIANCPYIDNFIYFNTTKKHIYEATKEKTKNFWYYVKLLRQKKYDKAYILKRSLSSAFLVFFAGIKDRIGFDTEGRGFLLTKKVKYDKNKHEIECFLDCLRQDGIEIKNNYLENTIDKKAQQKIDLMYDYLNIKNIKKVVVHATSTVEGKCWAKENFAKIIEYLANEKKVQVIFYGTKSDKNKYDEILSICERQLEIAPINLCGELNLKESLALTKSVNLLIGADSGNLHMAASVGTPLIGLYGPMNFNKWKAHSENAICLKANLECMPCSLKKPCKLNYKCMKLITPKMVIEKINQVLT